jgi:hypothetical protein
MSPLTAVIPELGRGGEDTIELRGELVGILALA